MKIAIASDIYYPMTNGVAVFAHNLANGLAQAGHEVLVIAPSFTGEYYEEIDEKTGVKTVHLSSIRFPFYPDQINPVPDNPEFLGMPLPRLTYKNGIWWTVNPWVEVKKVLDKFQPDVIHLQTAEFIALAVMSYVKKRNIPLVSTGHAYPDNITDQLFFLQPKPLKKLSNAILKAHMMSFLKNSEYATMPTEIAIGDLVPKNRKYFKVPVEALSNGVDLSQFKPAKASSEILKKYQLDDGKDKIMYIGRVDPEKSIDVVVKAFALLLADGISNTELVIVGDGIDMARLKELTEELDISDEIKFLGKIMMPELAKVYRMGTIFATGSETETQGIVLIEAAATGLPLVAVNAGAVGEICVNGFNGELVEAGNIEAFKEAMKKILLDKKLQKEYSKNSLEISKKHDLKHTLKRFEEIYEEAIRLKRAEIEAEAE